MKTYIGTKIIKAEAMGKQDFHNSIRKFPTMPDNVAGYKVVYADGYVSWSPKAVFDVAYREITDGEQILLTGIFSG